MQGDSKRRLGLAGVAWDGIDLEKVALCSCMCSVPTKLKNARWKEYVEETC